MAEKSKKPCAIDESAKTKEQLKPEHIERVQMEQMEGGNEASFRGVLQQAIVGVAQTDLSGRFTGFNGYYCRMLGYTEQELQRLGMQDVIHPGDLPANLAQFDQLVAGGADVQVEMRFLRKDGSELWVCNQINAIRDAEGKPRSLVVISLDVTEHKRTEQALRKSEERLMKVLQTETVGVLFFDCTGTIIDANKTFLNHMGYTRSDVEARRLTWQKLTPAGVDGGQLRADEAI
jgi:PAS domain S-box-containing protein